MISAEEAARMDGAARTMAVMTEKMRAEVDAAYRRGLDDASGGGVVAMLAGAVSGALVVGLMAWVL